MGSTQTGDQTQGLFSPWLKRRRLAAVRPYLRGRVLDFGCGTGDLCAGVTPEDYLGYDIDEESLACARAQHPAHRFVAELPAAEPFDTIVAAAVIEHVDDPALLLSRLAAQLAPGGCIVLTTPHPCFHWAHHLGARLGIFSVEADSQHRSFLDQLALGRLAQAAGLMLIRYGRFLGGANQLAVMERAQRSADGQ